MSNKPFKAVCSVIDENRSQYGGNILTCSGGMLIIRGIYTLDLNLSKILEVSKTKSFVFKRNEIRIRFLENGKEISIVLRLRRKKRDQLMLYLNQSGINM